MAVSRQDLRQDASKYVEGVQQGNVINLELHKNSIMIPGYTFTSSTLNDAGKLEIPFVSTTALQTPSKICEDGNVSDVAVSLKNVDIDKKISEAYNGCFVSAGIADAEITSAINTQKTSNMRKSYEADFRALITDAANSTAGTVIDQATAWNKLLAERTAFVKRTGEMPTAVYVSADFEAKIIAEKIARETTAGDETLARGVIGEVLGMAIISDYELTKDFVMVYAPAIHVVTPLKTSQINSMITGNGPLSVFSKGVQLIEETRALAGISRTIAHKYYGMAVIDKKYITVAADDTKK